jgi:hypothetical protein
MPHQLHKIAPKHLEPVVLHHSTAAAQANFIHSGVQPMLVVNNEIQKPSKVKASQSAVRAHSLNNVVVMPQSANSHRGHQRKIVVFQPDPEELKIEPNQQLVKGSSPHKTLEPLL